MTASAFRSRLNFYTTEELELIVKRGARVLKCEMSEDGAREIARRARGTPRVAGRLLRRVRDFAAVDGAPTITAMVADKALRELEVDAEGLDMLDHRYLKCIAVNYEGGPVGIETIAAALSEPRDALEEIIEPYLLAAGLHRPHAAGPRLHHEDVPASGADGADAHARSDSAVRRRSWSNVGATTGRPYKMSMRHPDASTTSAAAPCR